MRPQRFVNTTFNPDFAVSGEQMVRATPVNFGFKTDGVIALDIKAIGHLLDATGPIDTEFYGKLTGKNVAQKLIIDAYKSGSDDDLGERPARRQRPADGSDAQPADRGRRPDRPRPARSARRSPAGTCRCTSATRPCRASSSTRAWPAPSRLRDTGNLSAVYTQNGNGNKLDVFQRRAVRETVRLRADGSAVVTRTVALQSPTPPYTAPFPDRLRGYDTRYATNLVINLMPPGAKVLEQPEVLLSTTVSDGVDQAGRTYAQAAIMLPPDGSAELTWKYRVQNAAVVRGDRMYFRDYVVPQSMLRAPTLDLTVIAPEGWTADPAAGWTPTPKGVTGIGADGPHPGAQGPAAPPLSGAGQGRRLR